LIYGTLCSSTKVAAAQLAPTTAQPPGPSFSPVRATAVAFGTPDALGKLAHAVNTRHAMAAS
ncbi:MAG: hypothetical protein ACPIOQ_24965, partial [Promethearchaeia archaeon]